MARLALATSFFMVGAGIGSWIPHIPSVQAKLAMSEGVLGLALFALAAGAVLALALVGRFTARWGSPAVIVAGNLLAWSLLPLTVMAGGFWPLVAVLFIIGFGIGCVDVAMNANALIVERRMGSAILSSFHAFFSIGGMAGAWAAVALAARGVNPLAHLTGVALVFILVTLVSARALLRGGADTDRSPKPSMPWRAGGALGLAAIAFLAVMGEGAVADWAGIHLRDALHLRPELVGTGFAAFSVAMAVMRLGADRLGARFGDATIIRWGGVLGGLGLLVAVNAPSLPIALAGYSLLGLGIAPVFPMAIRWAGAGAPGDPGAAVARIAAFGYVGWLLGPPIVGGLAELVGLGPALGIVALALILVVPPITVAMRPGLGASA